MKKLILGITLFVCGVLGILTCMLISAIISTTNGWQTMWYALDSFGLFPFLTIFILIAIVGKIVCIIEIYSDK